MGDEALPAGIHRLGTEWVNWYLVEEGGRLTAVDAGLASYSDDLERKLPALGFSLTDIDAVVLTHSDFDHAGLIPQIREAGARVLIHEADEGTLRKPGAKSGDARATRFLRLMRHRGFRKFAGHMIKGGALRPKPVEGAETFTGGQALDVPGNPRVIATPGHTPGHVAFLFAGRGALFTGDALVTWSPITGERMPQLMPSGTNVSDGEARRSLDAIASATAEWILPGHGEPLKASPAEAVAAARP